MLLALLSCAGKAGAQTVAVKSDLLTGGMLASPNLGVELSCRNVLRWRPGFITTPFRQEETGAGNTGSYSRSCATGCASYGGHFFGANLMYGVYNVAKARLPFGLFKGIRSERYEGDLREWEYHTAITSSSPRWGLETSIGVGFLHTGYERYRCSHCGERTGSGNRNLVAPTKAAISIVYMIK